MAILFRSTPAAAVRWRPLLGRLMPEHEIRYWPEIGDRAAIEYALVWQPEPGLLASLPNLKLIVGLGAGVDHVLGDPLLPKGVPIVRLVDPYMTDAMSEYVTLSVLRLLGQDAGKKLKALGFDVAGWSRGQKEITGFACYAGPVGLDAMLARSEILVC